MFLLLRKHWYYKITLLQWLYQLVSSPADLVFQAVYPPMSFPASEITPFKFVIKQTGLRFQFCCQTGNYK